MALTTRKTNGGMTIRATGKHAQLLFDAMTRPQAVPAAPDMRKKDVPLWAVDFESNEDNTSITIRPVRAIDSNQAEDYARHYLGSQFTYRCVGVDKVEC